MAYYWGKFRSIDTSVDPLGQEYKVVIFTQYDGTYSPYSFNFEGEPVMGTELKMSSQPFTVGYSNEADNIYKPYKCSTATVRFMMSSFDPLLFTNKDNNIMVTLLRRNNNIQLRGDEYVDIRTNQVVIRKRAYGLFYGFLPSEVDTYLYDVEWIGYAIPQTYNQNYALVEEEFELECQDAFSSLKTKIFPFNEDIEIYDAKRLINIFVGQLGTYRHVYYSDALKLPVINQETTAFASVVTQYRNFISDDDTPINKLSVMEAIAQFMNVVIVPHKNDIYIVSYEGTAGRYPYFYEYTLLPNNNLFFNYRTDTMPTYSDNRLVNLSSVIQLDKDCFAGSDTNLSMQNVCDAFAVKSAEKEYDLMPDLADAKNYSRLQSNGRQTGTYMYTETLAPSDPTESTYYEMARWDGGVVGELQPVDGVGFTSYIYTASYLDSSNLPQSNYTPVSPDLYTSIFNINPANTYNATYYTGCVILKNTKIKGSESGGYRWFNTKATTTLYNEAYGNTIVFWGKKNFGHIPSVSNYNSWWESNSQVALAYTSPMIVLRNNKYINIKGDWTFFRNNAFIYLPINDNTRVGWGTDGLDVTVDKARMYVKARIKVMVRGTNTTYYAYSDGQDRLFLTATPTICNLALDDTEYNKKQPFGQRFSLKNSVGEDSGLCINLDNIFASLSNNTEAVVRITMEIMTPFGCAQDSTGYMVACNSAKLENFYIGLLDRDLNEAWGYSKIETNFHTQANGNDEKFEVNNKLSSNQYVNKMAYNYTFRSFNSSYHILDNVNNVATGIIGRPELLKLADIHNQYSTMTIGMYTTLWHGLNITPNTLFTYHGRDYIVDSINIDYEMDRDTVTLMQKKLSPTVPQAEQKMYLENENGQTVNFNPFYGETFTPVTVDSYHPTNTSKLVGIGGEDVNCYITAWVNFDPDGIFLLWSRPEQLGNINIYINNNELIIEN